MIGTKLGPYEITAKLGEGGMGEVYRATDSKLRREVAIKVLPAAFTADPERLARFEREAQLLAQLHHPNIASIFGLEESGGSRALVMELVPGPTLAERLAAGPLPVAESLRIARQIADALEEAHEKGIVHRDLKPQNVKAAPDGKVKVLDFGLAKAMEPTDAEAARSPALVNSPTLTAAAYAAGTQLGVILGTAAYMAPEQARGGTVDKRADIWAFGVVLYEMLTGRMAFAAPTVPDTLAAVLTRPLDWSLLPPSTPPAIRQLLRRCLERDPRNRLRDIGDARLAIEETRAPGSEVAGVATPATPATVFSWRRALPWAIAGAAVALSAWAIATRSAGGPTATEPPAVTRLEFSLPSGVEAASGIAGGFAISPDGRTIAMIGVREGTRRLFVRRLDRAATTEITVSSGVNSAAFSPDSSALVFIPGNAEVTRFGLDDQQRTVIFSGADLSSTIGWGESGIYFHRNGALWTVPPAGGEARQLVELDTTRGDVQHSDPIEIPGSGRVLYTTRISNEADSGRIESVAVTGGTPSVVIERGSTPVWSPTGHLLFERDDAVWAVPFDRKSVKVAGAAVQIVKSGEIGKLRFGGLGFRLSEAGTLVTMPPDFAEGQIATVSRDGTERALGLPTGPYASPRVSPDGKRLVVERASSTIEVVELARGTRTQLAPSAWGSSFPIWTADGERVVSRRFNMPYWIAADASGRSGRIEGCGINDYPVAAGPDADSVLTVRIQARTGGDLMLASISGRSPPKALLDTPAYEGGPQLSPDRNWLVYQSNATGKAEIFVRRYPALDRAWQVSEGGGVQTRWSVDGREIYFRSAQGMMAATFDGRGAEPVLGRPVTLFADEYDYGQGLSIPNYDVTADGKFLMLRRTPAGGRFHVVLGWTGELERLISTGGVR